MCKALLFDLDGTLAETDSVHFPAWAEILRPRGYDADWAFFQERISGRLNPEVVAEFLPDLSEEEAREIVERKESHFRERAAALEPLPGSWTSLPWPARGTSAWPWLPTPRSRTSWPS